MIMKKILIYIISVCLFGLVACQEENLLQPYGGDKNAIPDPVSNVRVENIPGGAVLHYDLPKDANLLSVKAVYQGTNGKQQVVSASAYVDSLKIVGLGDTNDYEVSLYTVSYMEKASQPVIVTITPQTPPVQRVFKSLDYYFDFGGFAISYENETGSDIAIYALRKDSTGTEMEYYDALYTSMKQGTYAVRGLPDKENEFAIYVRDRYENMSDTIFFTGTPLREDELDKELFNYIQLPGDVTWNYADGWAEPTYAWNGIIANDDCAHTEFPVEFPHRLTIDLGVNVKLSRFRMWPRTADDVLYQHGQPKVYRVYGRADKPNPQSMTDDPMAGWTLLKECTSIKPSNLPLGQYSSEDLEYQSKGEEFSFPKETPVIRYIRFEMLQSWSGMKCSVISELSFWGQIQQ